MEELSRTVPCSRWRSLGLANKLRWHVKQYPLCLAFLYFGHPSTLQFLPGGATFIGPLSTVRLGLVKFLPEGATFTGPLSTVRMGLVKCVKQYPSHLDLFHLLHPSTLHTCLGRWGALPLLSKLLSNWAQQNPWHLLSFIFTRTLISLVAALFCSFFLFPFFFSPVMGNLTLILVLVEDDPSLVSCPLMSLFSTYLLAFSTLRKRLPVGEK